MPASRPRRVSVLGATGSIGRNTLDVIRHFSAREDFRIVALTGRANVDLLASQAVEFGAEIAVTADEGKYGALKAALAGTGIEAAAGAQALEEAAARSADWVMAGIVGIAGLAPTLAAAQAGATIALANKECLVSAGDLFLAECAASGSAVLPVDSEHNAIFQVLETNQRQAVERIILTASGGPFRDWAMERMAQVTPQIAAAHPNWSMGMKISIDSATMFNKALEMIEARHLFAVEPRQIEVVVHPQSVIHSMVGYADGSVLAQMGSPDMRTAIGFALAWPRRAHVPVERLDFAKLSRLDFETPDEQRFPALRLAREAMDAGGVSGAILNGAKEAALEAFIAGKIGFLDIARAVEETLERLDAGEEPDTLEAVYEADRQARATALELMAA
ncbi:MAG: 1-deoxy-D-xylulose-5-phosphate reductoisomerase [Nitratireductor sp.]|nr:1-deoxy-D-xylulose-5-phosphate reductoisomerase [Nitratireductor sp.]